MLYKKSTYDKRLDDKYIIIYFCLHLKFKHKIIYLFIYLFLLSSHQISEDHGGGGGGLRLLRGSS
jgi:hypothetical protein